LAAEEVFYIHILPPWEMYFDEQLGEMALVQEWFSSPPKNIFSHIHFYLLSYALIMWQNIKHSA